MKVVLFCHSLSSDWNHGNAHFLRGVVTELTLRGHDVHSYEPRDAWSVQNLLAEHGELAARAVEAAYPDLPIHRYDLSPLLGGDGLDRALDDADLVLVHEWNDPALVAAIGRHRARHGGYRVLFHDTHHRSVTQPEAMARYDLSAYDGVLAFGEAVRQVYLRAGWSRRVWTWHEAADTRVFKPLRPAGSLDADLEGDLVWVGNWGDDERTAELHAFLLDPVRALGLVGTVHGVRYPAHGIAALGEAGLSFAGWLPNFEVPRVFARHRMTVHVPRRPYATALPGVPTIRVFEALACGIPLLCAPWDDAEGLFRPGTDYLVARDGAEMTRHMRAVATDPELARELGEQGRQTVLARHTCAHRVDELMSICQELDVTTQAQLPPSARSEVAR